MTARRFITPIDEHIIEYVPVEGYPQAAEDPPYVQWFGPAPRLNTQDAGTSYLHVDTLTSLTLPSPAIELPRFPDFTEAILHVQLRVEGPNPTFSVDAYVFDDGGNNAYAEVAGPTFEWITVESPLELLSGELEPSGGPIYALVIGTGFAPDSVVDVSWIAVSEADAIPTRVYPRADGLGMGAPRLMDMRSPYRSARVFGMI